MRLECFLTPYTNINSKHFKDLNARHKTIKLLEEDIGQTVFDINCNHIFLGPVPGGKNIIARITKIDYNYNKQILLVLNNIFLSVYYSIHIVKYSINIYETQEKAQKKSNSWRDHQNHT